MAFPTGWARKCPLVIQGSLVPANQTAFPVVISNASGCLPAEMVTTGNANAAQADGGDIRFSSDAAGATQLACEVVAWSQNATAANAVAEIWVSVNVTGGANTTIYVWYSAGGGQSQPAANAPFGSQAVWDSNEKARFHLQAIAAGPSGGTADSTSSANDLLNAGASDVGTTAAQFGTLGANFAGSMRLEKSSPNGMPTTGARTVMYWAKRANNTGGDESYGGWGGNTTDGDRWDMVWNVAGFYVEIRNDGASYGTTPDTNWHHFAWTFPGGGAHIGATSFYLDGVNHALTTGGSVTVNSSNINLTLGRAPTFNAQLFVGVLDEWAISNVARSANWITTTYNNQVSPGTFIIAGSPGPPSVSAVPFICVIT